MKLSFKWRVLLGCLLVALIPLLICSFVMVRVFEVNLRSQTWQSGELQIARVNEELGRRFASYEEAARIVAGDRLVAELLLSPDELRKNEVYLTLYRATDKLRGGVQFQLYDKQGVLRYTTDSAPAAMSLSRYNGVLRQAADNRDRLAYADIEGERILMRCAQAIPDGSGGIAGFVAASLNEQSFAEALGGLYDNTSTLYIVDSFFEPVYSNSMNNIDSAIASLRTSYLETGTLPYDPENNLSYHLAVEPLSGYYLIIEQPAQITGGALELMNTISLGATIVCLGLCLVVSLLLSRSLTKPLEQLSSAMERVKQGEFETRVSLDRTDELGSLANSFNRMASDLDIYMKSLVQRQQELDDTRIRMLQAQLNPHFLYNTLDTMKWTAKMHGVPEVACLASNLAVILRRSISSERFVTLEQEMEMSRRYIDIQCIRFSGKFTYVFDIPDELAECYVPKLVLQPLLENAIIHGLRDSDSGYLYVYAIAREDELHLSVTDDGCGMDSDTVNSLNSGKYELREGHLGLYNVNTILRMYYGEQYGLSASSIEATGTTVTAVLPMRREVCEGDEGSNS